MRCRLEVRLVVQLGDEVKIYPLYNEASAERDNTEGGSHKQPFPFDRPETESAQTSNPQGVGCEQGGEANKTIACTPDVNSQNGLLVRDLRHPKTEHNYADQIEPQCS